MALKFNSLAIIIPMYNEEKGASTCIKKVIEEIKNFKTQIKLIVVDDGSTDSTLGIINSETKKHSEILLKAEHKINKGYGAAIRSGIDLAFKKGFTYALFMDSDLTNDPSDIKKFVKEMENGYDCVKASRYIKGGKVVSIPFKRRFFSLLGNFTASLLFQTKVRDVTNGFRMTKLEKLNKINLKEKGFAIIMEEFYCLRKQKATFKEIPITLRPRKNGKSNFSYSLSTLVSYIKYPIKFALS